MKLFKFSFGLPSRVGADGNPRLPGASHRRARRHLRGLSLAQVAALGVTLAVLAARNFMVKRRISYRSDSHAFWGGGLCDDALSQANPPRGVIGIVYAVCAAAAILIMDRLPKAPNTSSTSSSGNLLAVTHNGEIAKMAILYSSVGAAALVVAAAFPAISRTRHGSACQTGYNVRLWDFLFYGTLGICRHLVRSIAGVLLVFSYLSCPVRDGDALSDKIGTRLAVGWATGCLVSFLGMYGSYKLDAPTGATVVCTFGLALLILAALRPLLRGKYPARF